MRPAASLSAALLLLIVRAAAAQPIPAGGEFQVDTGGSSPQNPAIAANLAGSFAVAWDEPTRIASRRYDATGAAQGPDVQVNTYMSGNPRRPSVSMDSAGNFVVVWDSVGQDGDARGIFGQRFDAAGAAQGAEFGVNSYTTGDQSAASVAMDANGNFLVVWNGQGVATGDVHGQRFDAAGVPQGPEFLVNTYTTGSQYGARVAANGGGNFVVAWQSIGQDGDGSGVFAQRFDGGGVALGSEFRVNTYTPAEQYAPAVAGDPSGNFLVVWTTTGEQDGSASGIIGRRYDASGAPLWNEFHVNTSAKGYQTQPAAVAANAGGGFVVSWVSGIVRSSVFARRFDVDGIALGPNFQVDTDPIAGDGQLLAPAVAASATDAFVVAWSRRFDGERIGARRYASDAPMTGKRLVVRDSSDVTRRSVLLLSQDPSLSTAATVGIDPVTYGGYLHVFNGASGDSACFPLPASGWMATGKPTRPVFRYRDPGYANGPCKVVNFKHGRILKANCKADVQPIAYSLDEGQQGSVSVIFGSGLARYCGVFGGTVVKDNNVQRQFFAKEAPAPAGCPVPPAACP